MGCEGILTESASDGKVAKDSTQGVIVNKIVNIPYNVSFNRCHPPNLSLQACETVRQFKEKHKDTQHSLFQMGIDVCDDVPATSNLRSTRGWFYWKYWGRHGQMSENVSGATRKARRGSAANLQLDDKELIVAVHARRGDFLLAQNSARQATS